MSFSSYLNYIHLINKSDHESYICAINFAQNGEIINLNCFSLKTNIPFLYKFRSTYCNIITLYKNKYSPDNVHSDCMAIIIYDMSNKCIRQDCNKIVNCIKHINHLIKIKFMC